MKKIAEIYRGKAKTIFSTDNLQYVIMHFRDDATAFNGIKKAQFEKKGKINNQFNAYIMQKLAEAGIPVHFEKIVCATESLVKSLKMIPVECVMRNIAAGNLSKRLGIKEGVPLDPPIFEFFLKSDELNDPMLNEYHIRTLNLASDEDIETMKALTFKTNEVLKALFASADMLFVDFKLEFGRFENKIYLGDEITPDGCRIWDRDTLEKLDKDRFRRDLGNVIESYEMIAKRLGIPIQ